MKSEIGNSILLKFLLICKTKKKSDFHHETEKFDETKPFKTEQSINENNTKVNERHYGLKR